MKQILVVYQYITNNDIYEFNINHINKMINESKYDIDIELVENIDIEKLKNKYNYHHDFYDSSKTTGLNFLILLDAYINHKDEYEYYLFWEEDLIFNSERNIFDDICDNFKNYDIVFQNKRKLNHYWFWGLHNYLNNIKVKGYKPYEGLLNIYFMNSKVMEDLLKFMNDGNWAHHEYLINSYIIKHKDKYNIGYLSNIYKVYTDFNRLSHNKNYKEYDLVHPIKTLEDYSELL